MNTATLMPRFGEYLLRSAQDRFNSQEGPDGERWTALRHPERKKRNADKILTLRGFLRRSIRWQASSARSVEVGTNLVYAATHQFGRDEIPARPFLGVSDADQKELLAITLDWLREQAGGH